MSHDEASMMFALTALSPLDGRYEKQLKPLATIFSEYGLMHARVRVEIAWLQMLSEIIPSMSKLPASIHTTLNDLCQEFSLADGIAIKKIESRTNHDVKAIEYFIKERFQNHAELAALLEFIHFGCTSEDVNNLAYGLMLKNYREEVLLPEINQVLSVLLKLAHDYADLPMLARTHGQAATPTTVGKEIANVSARLKRQIQQLATLPILGKWNGATGNYSACQFAYPDIDWPVVSDTFISRLGLNFNPYTTQIEPHDNISEFLAIVTRINTILIDFNRDMWGYIALDYFKQRPVENEVGSSTMPHKINPIDFENAEGNLGIANALSQHLQIKLPISRWQRDLSDSTVLRNLGVIFGYTRLAIQSTLKGLRKVEPHHAKIAADLDAHWEVLAEAIQTVMRAHQLPEPYEQLKNFTRGKVITADVLHDFIQTIDLPAAVKSTLLTLTPANYTGYAMQLARKI